MNKNEIGERIPIGRNEILTPIEHFLIGSTPEGVNGKSLDVFSLMEEKDNNLVRKILLTPVIVNKGRYNLREIIKARNEYEKNRIEGMFPILDIKSLLMLNKLKITTYFKLAAIDKDSGLIEPSWEVGPIDNNNLRTSEHFDLLIINKALDEKFSLEESPDKKTKTLKYKL